jgi:pimeloyl-ACP methyl ester carboxylesterase
MFQASVFRRCREKLEKNADLRLYSTPIAMDDLDDLRKALDYEKVILVGGSYGTRAALTYLQRHGEHVGSVVLLALNPFSFKNPLYHAKSAQIALGRLLEECSRQPNCRQAFPNVREELATVLQRLGKDPVLVSLAVARTGKAVQLRIGLSQFSEALRVISYTPESASQIPPAIHHAFLGDYKLFARVGLSSNIGLRKILRFGMLMSVTCSEDVARIGEAEILVETKGTYLGDDRVRQQIAACKEWPSSELPKDFDKARRSDVPALLISGYYDPTTPPNFGEEVARDYLPNSIHLVTQQAGHSATSPCTDEIGRQFLRSGSTSNLDTSCIARMKLMPFAVEQNGQSKRLGPVDGAISNPATPCGDAGSK